MQRNIPLIGLLAIALAGGASVAQADSRYDGERRAERQERHQPKHAKQLRGERRDHGRHDSGHKRHAGADFDHRVDQRQARQHDRIHHGIRNGTLNRHEARDLRHQQKRIAKLERRFGADGHYSRHERKRLDRALDHASRNIRGAKHNRHDRYDRHGRGHGYAYRYDVGPRAWHWDYRR